MGKTASAPATEDAQNVQNAANKPKGIRKKKALERKMDSFMNKLARKVGTLTTSSVDSELDKLYRFALDRLTNTAQLIDGVYSKSDTIKPSLFHAAVQTLMVDAMRDVAMEAGAEAVSRHLEEKKASKAGAEEDENADADDN
jgi:hypothetical protein